VRKSKPREELESERGGEKFLWRVSETE